MNKISCMFLQLQLSPKSILQLFQINPQRGTTEPTEIDNAKWKELKFHASNPCGKGEE